MLKRGPGFLPPVTPGQGRPRDDVVDRITSDDLDKLYSDDDNDGDKNRNSDKFGPTFQPPTGFGGFFGPGMGFGGIFGPGGGFGGFFGEGHGPSNPFQGPALLPNPNFGGQSDDDEVRNLIKLLQHGHILPGFQLKSSQRNLHIFLLCDQKYRTSKVNKPNIEKAKLDSS